MCPAVAPAGTTVSAEKPRLELATRHPANGEAIRRNPASPRDWNALRAGRGNRRSAAGGGRSEAISRKCPVCRPRQRARDGRHDGERRMAKKKAPSSQMVPFGAGDEARTRYLDLGKVALYQMSYARKRKIDYTRESRICQPLRSTFFNFFSKEFR